MGNIKKTYLFIKILVYLIAFDTELKFYGFNKLFKRYELKFQLKKEITSYNLFDDYEPQRVVEFFEMLDVVCAWYPKKADCVHKTFLGYRILREKYSLPVNMVVGIRKFPFEAHAWIQLFNHNFFEDEEDTCRYNIILKSV